MENDKLVQLKNISEKLLDPKIEAGELKITMDELKNLLVSITQLEYESTSNRQNFQLPTGIGIYPVWVPMCLEDIESTKVFMQSLHQAVNEVKKRITNFPIKILYAGTGPFATLVCFY